MRAADRGEFAGYRIRRTWLTRNKVGYPRGFVTGFHSSVRRNPRELTRLILRGCLRSDGRDKTERDVSISAISPTCQTGTEFPKAAITVRRGRRAGHAKCMSIIVGNVAVN